MQHDQGTSAFTGSPRREREPAGPDRGGILADLRAGLAYREIAAKRKCSTDTVLKVAAANGITRKRGRKKGDTCLDYDGILADLQAGLTHTEIAARRNCSVDSISRCAGANGLARTGGRRKGTGRRPDYDDILADLRAGYVYHEIAERRGAGIETISRIAIANGLGRKNWRAKSPSGTAGLSSSLSPELEEQAARRYGVGESSKVIAADLGADQSTVLKAIRKQGVKVRGMGKVQRPLRHDAFDDLTPEAMYWLGFLFTDGTVGHRDNGQDEVALVLQKRDRGHLVKFRDFLGSENTITPIAPAVVKVSAATPYGGMGTGAVRFAARSQHIADVVRYLGRYGPAVHPALAASRHFWRGCVDGDGTLGVGCGIEYLGLVGSHWLMSAFSDFLGPIGRRGMLNPHPARTLFVVRAGGRTAVKVIDLLYSGATVALDRKAERAARILAARGGLLF